jgi:hypothetical protein
MKLGPRRPMSLLLMYRPTEHYVGASDPLFSERSLLSCGSNVEATNAARSCTCLDCVLWVAVCVLRERVRVCVCGIHTIHTHTQPTHTNHTHTPHTQPQHTTTHRQKYRHTDTQTHTDTYIQPYTHTYKQTHRHTHTDTHTYTHRHTTDTP